MKMMNKVCALMLSAALCAGMAVPAFAYGGDVPEEVEQPILTAASDEEDSITVTDEETGALTPEGNLSIVDDYHTSYLWLWSAVHYAGQQVGQHVLSGHRPQRQGPADGSLYEFGGRS